MMNPRAEEYTNGWVPLTKDLPHKIYLCPSDAFVRLDFAENSRLAYVKITSPVGKNEAYEILWEVDTKEVLRAYIVGLFERMYITEIRQGRTIKSESQACLRAALDFAMNKIGAKKLALVSTRAKDARKVESQEPYPPIFSRHEGCLQRNIHELAAKELEDAAILLVEPASRNGTVGKLVFSACWHAAYCEAINWTNYREWRENPVTDYQRGEYIDRIANQMLDNENERLLWILEAEKN